MHGLLFHICKKQLQLTLHAAWNTSFTFFSHTLKPKKVCPTVPAEPAITLNQWKEAAPSKSQHPNSRCKRLASDTVMWESLQPVSSSAHVLPLGFFSFHFGLYLIFSYCCLLVQYKNKLAVIIQLTLALTLDIWARLRENCLREQSLGWGWGVKWGRLELILCVCHFYCCFSQGGEQR